MKAVFDKTNSAITISLTPQEANIVDYVVSKYTTSIIELLFLEIINGRSQEMMQDKKDAVWAKLQSDPEVMALLKAKGVNL